MAREFCVCLVQHTSSPSDRDAPCSFPRPPSQSQSKSSKSCCPTAAASTSEKRDDPAQVKKEGGWTETSEKLLCPRPRVPFPRKRTQEDSEPPRKRTQEDTKYEQSPLLHPVPEPPFPNPAEALSPALSGEVGAPRAAHLSPSPTQPPPFPPAPIAHPPPSPTAGLVPYPLAAVPCARGSARWGV